MTKEELGEKLELHRQWLEDSNVGERLNLRYVDLRYADLKYTDLRYADLKGTNLRYADLRYADLRYADLKDADLKYTDLRYADLDYSVFPLWCGGINWTVEEKLPQMLCAFICSMECDDNETKEIQKLIRPYAEKSHRANDILN